MYHDRRVSRYPEYYHDDDSVITGFGNMFIGIGRGALTFWDFLEDVGRPGDQSESAERECAERERIERERICKRARVERERVERERQEQSRRDKALGGWLAAQQQTQDAVRRNHSDLAEFLDNNNLSEYLNLLIKDGYDTTDDLQDLTDKDLKTAGMSKSGHRKRLLRAINIGDKKLDTSQGFYNGVPLL